MYKPIGRTKKILVNSAPLVQKILMGHSDSLDKSLELRKFGTPLLGKGMLISDNSLNRKLRRLVAPAFQPQRMKAYTEVTAEYSERICRAWSAGQKIDVHREMARLTLWTVGKNLFNADVLSEADELGGALTQAITGFDSQLRALVPLTIQWPTPKNIAFAQVIRRLNKTTLALIAQRKSAPVEHIDLLSMLLNASYEDGSPMTNLQIQDEVVNFFMAGFETSATALTWAWYLLSQHPAVYQKLRGEVDAVLRGRTPSFADLPELRYTLQVLREVLRLYPPVHCSSAVSLKGSPSMIITSHPGRLSFLVPSRCIAGRTIFPIPNGSTLIVSHRRMRDGYLLTVGFPSAPDAASASAINMRC